MVRRADRRLHCGGKEFFAELTEALCAAIRLHVRYDTNDEHGETRRERNERYHTPSPEIEIPPGANHFWEWYFELANGISRVSDGVCYPANWSEFFAWSQVMETPLKSWEFEILRAMDIAFCAETNIEFEAYRERQKEKAKQNAPSKGKR